MKDKIAKLLSCVVLAALLAGAVAVYLMYFTHEKRAVRNRLSEADMKSKKAIDERLKPLAQLFAKGRKGSGAFAKEAMSWSGKWAFIKDFGEPGAHRAFLAESFARHVFTPDELRNAIESVCRAYADDLDGVEGEMLVLLRADIADPDRPAHELSPHLRTNEAFNLEYRKLNIRVANETGTDIGVTVGREVAVLVGTEVASRAALSAARAAATEMGIQGGLMGAGASSSLATIGMGLVVALIIDAIIDEMFKLVGYDAETKIKDAVIESIDKMEDALTRDGWMEERLGIGKKKGALRLELEKLHESRSKLRRETVELMLKQGGQK